MTLRLAVNIDVGYNSCEVKISVEPAVKSCQLETKLLSSRPKSGFYDVADFVSVVEFAAIVDK